jgi:hypothetical protein
MLWKDRITPAADCHPEAGKLLGPIGEHQAEPNILDKLQRRPFIMNAQTREPAEASVALSFELFDTIAHDGVIPPRHSPGRPASFAAFSSGRTSRAATWP